MSVKKKATVAGNTIFIDVKGSGKKVPGGKRTEKEKVTPEQIEKMRRINQRNSEKSLCMLINHNFGPGDLHLVLTHSGKEPTPKEAEKELKKFFDRFRYLSKKEQTFLKWIRVTEYKNARIHHHIICNGDISLEKIVQLWTRGFVRPTFLDNTKDYRKLAAYLIKETSKTFRNPDAPQKCRYSCSRSIVKPEPRQEEVSASHLLDPKPITGYYIDQDSIYRGKNPITGQPCLEYVMVSLDAEPRLKKWNRGKKVKFQTELFKINENEQIEMILEQIFRSA